MSIHNWHPVTMDASSASSVQSCIDLLAKNEIAAAVLPKMYTPTELIVITDNINREGVNWYPNFEFKQGRIGLSATEYQAKINGKQLYFLAREEAEKIRNRIFPGELDPVERTMLAFSKSYRLEIAKEPSISDSAYFAGIVRAMQVGSTTHYDFAPDQLADWGVAKAEAQFAVVTYIQVPDQGGDLIIYRCQGSRSYDMFNKDVDEKGPRGFDSEFLMDVESINIKPIAGDMIIFNSRNFHRVENMNSLVARYSVNSFITVREDQWSLWV